MVYRSNIELRGLSCGYGLLAWLPDSDELTPTAKLKRMVRRGTH
jgi:hypothetical protein